MEDDNNVTCPHCFQWIPITDIADHFVLHGEEPPADLLQPKVCWVQYLCLVVVKRELSCSIDDRDRQVDVGISLK